MSSATQPAPVTDAVGILLPFRDAATTLPQALSSVLNQTNVRLRLYAIDDHSSDASLSVVDKVARRDPRVIVVSNAGRGLVDALRTGLDLCHEPFIGRMDSDDISEAGRFALQVRFLRNNPTVGVVGARVRLFPSHEVQGGMTRYVAWQNSLLSPADHARELFIESPLCHPSVLLRRQALFDAGGWRHTPWAEDYDLWLRLDALGWGLAKLPDMLLRWRQRPNQMTRTDTKLSRQRFMQARAAYLPNRLRGRPFAIWGAGPTGKRLARELESHGLRPERVVDVARRKIGQTSRGIKVEPIDWLASYAGVVLVAVGARGTRQRIRAFLHEHGMVEGDDFIFAS